MDEIGLDALVGALRAAVDVLLGADLSCVSSAGVTGALAALEVERRRLEAVDQRVVAEVEARGASHDYGRGSTADLLVQLLRVTPAEAKGRVARARDLGPRRALTGEPLPPILPAVAQAVRAGEISSAQVSVIARYLDRIPAHVAHQVAAAAEGLLVEAARHEHPGQLARTGELLLARLDPDGAEPRDREHERRRAFALRKYADGSSTPTGRFTPELTAAIDALLGPLAAPVPAADGLPDDRSPTQRRHDAVADAVMRLLRSGSLPAAGGAPVTILARTTMTELKEGVGVATSGTGVQFSLAQLMQMAAEADVIPVVLNDTGGILCYGRTRRFATCAQRLALAARDGGCSFPGCDRPAAWTEVHHIKRWIDYGGTDIDNMCLLCRYHHREFERRGWEVIMIDAVPYWKPPGWIDQDRRPIRNTAHHIDDFQFSA